VGQFGDKFKNAREKRNLSLDDVSNVTKIGSRMLQAIEEEHFDLLPGGVFNKGFIRAYAKHLGLNDEESVTEYLACLRQAQIDAQASWNPQARPPAPEKRPLVSAPAAKTTKEQPPPPREELPDLQLPKAEHLRPPRRLYGENRWKAIPWRLVVVAVVVVFLAAVLWNRRSHKARAGTTAAPPALQAGAQSANGAVSQSSAGNSSSPQRSSSTFTLNSHIPNPQAPALAQSMPSSAQASPHPIATVKANSNSAAPDDSNSAEPEVVTKTIQNTPLTATKTEPSAKPPASSTAASPTAASMTLVIRASENSWISVTADGQPVSQETLIAPAHTSVRASREIVVRTGNAAAVSFLWNGKEIPAQGTEAEVKTLVFDASGMRVLSTATGDQNR